jgi:hypothetical protein
MKNVEILGLTIVIDGDHVKTEIDLGCVTLSRQGREYILDPIQSYRNFEHGETKIEVDLEVDKETFPDCKFDLEDVDLIANDLKAEFYFRCETDWEYATLFVKINGMTKAIDLILEE